MCVLLFVFATNVGSAPARRKTAAAHKTYSGREWPAAQAAGSAAPCRDQIACFVQIACAREQPLPRLVLLDVMLPDSDGFDMLLRMWQHPVRMRCAAASRQASA